MDRPVLTPVEQRMLGALLEKEITVPAGYPLTLNALRTACNQSTSRDPVTEYTDIELETVARGLKERGLLRIVWAGGSRTLKYHQLLAESLGLDADERALLTVLLLRGPQSAGELKTRTERLHAFADRDEVQAGLQRLADRPDPLAAQLERRGGQHDPRWVQLLGPVPVGRPTDTASGGPTAPLDRDTVIAHGAGARDERVRSAYDTVADTYADSLRDELVHKPFDRWLLERVAGLAKAGPIADVGCGPGHVAAFLADAGAHVTGVDVAPAMVTRARADYPDLTFEVGDFMRLLRPPRAAGWSAIVAWYALVHLAGSELPGAVAALARTLDTGGQLALAVHVGEEIRHVTDWWGHEVDVLFVLHDPQAVRDAVTSAGLMIDEWYIRGPLAEVEAETQRLYVLAHKEPGA